ncbi:XRE family transcriptional regulator [Desulfolutivibrio sulfoxidireducens]|nr:XRE family transcriptional regulator [Desulfolutivibrio sulfoxidireducens]
MENVMADNSEAFYGSGNVFDDMGHPDAELKLQKSRLISAVSQLIKDRGLTQKQAAEIFNEDQSNLSKILRGHLRLVTSDRLMHWIHRLGENVTISITPCPKEQRPGVFVEIRPSL